VSLRHALDRLYGAAAWAAALFMIGTLVMILLSVTGRLLDFHVRGTDAYAGYCMAAAAFLALAHTLKRGEHIRVTLILDHTGAAHAAGTGTLEPCGGHVLAPFCWPGFRCDWRCSPSASTTSRKAPTPRRCGFRNPAWRSAHWCFSSP
jgi:hypothetical protein